MRYEDGFKSHQDVPMSNSSVSDTSIVAGNNINVVYAQVTKVNASKQQAANIYTESHIGEYDRLNDIQRRKIILNDEIYDKNLGTRDTNEPTYNTTMHFRQNNVVYDYAI